MVNTSLLSLSFPFLCINFSPSTKKIRRRVNRACHFPDNIIAKTASFKTSERYDIIIRYMRSYSLTVRMDEHIYISLFLPTIATVCLLFLTTLPQSHCAHQQPDNKYSNCSKPFNCGGASNIYYPFWDGDVRPRYCGGIDQFMLMNCEYSNDPDRLPSIRMGSQIFHVLEINTITYTMKMVQTDYIKDGYHYDVCSSPRLTNNSLNSTLFQYTQNVHNITIFYDCPPGNHSYGGKNITCKNDRNGHNWTFLEEEETMLQQYTDLHKCGEVIQVQVSRDVPLDPDSENDPLDQALKDGFEVRYFAGGDECQKCMKSNGTCGRNDAATNYEFSCHCPDGSEASLQCPGNKSNQWNWQRKVIIGVTGLAIPGLLLCITIYIFRCKSSTRQVNFWFTTKCDQDIEAFLQNHGPLALKRYKFIDVKKMTNSFKDKLGQGGFGAVYKGKLLSGCLVAVKILNASKENGEEFINEVASISRTSHVNIVTLLGFCFEGRKKALIYEFMPNGSLEKFINKEGPEATPSLSCENLYQIAIGIARGLEYLHRGCNARIVHFDIKPHNILLDEDFCPKISDFGLAKLCPRKESIISMSEARGTIGYVAPEVWNRHFGGVSHKSDVYSYGMMLLEMVGGRDDINAGTSHTSEYFPDWLYRRLELGNDLGPDGEVATEENEITKKMIVVGLWCIQTFPNHRPTMSRVIDMLEGNTNFLEIPPKPVLSSARRSVAESTTGTSN